METSLPLFVLIYFSPWLDISDLPYLPIFYFHLFRGQSSSLSFVDTDLVSFIAIYVKIPVAVAYTFTVAYTCTSSCDIP